MFTMSNIYTHSHTSVLLSFVFYSRHYFKFCTTQPSDLQTFLNNTASHRHNTYYSSTGLQYNLTLS